MLFRAILIGILISVPIGPLGLLCIHRTINRGWKIGLISGVGAALSDLIYSSIAIVGMGFIRELIGKRGALIQLYTGSLFLVIGLKIFIKSLKINKFKFQESQDLIHPCITSFLLGLSNPLTLFIFLVFFTLFRIDVKIESWFYNAIFLITIFLGSSSFWLFITQIIDRFRKRINIEQFLMLNRMIGLIIALAGLISIVRGVISIGGV